VLALVWAQARDAAGRPVIGAANALPWRVPEDAAHFKALTLGHPVVMGRATWDSLPARFRPLPGRTNVVVTRREGWRPEPDAEAGVVVAGSVDEALRAAATAPGGEETWVVGGAQVYAATVAAADRLEVTELDLVVEGDAWAPPIDRTRWRAERTGPWETSTSGVRYRFVTYAAVTPGD
jgi:dihydrofolate reductase